MANYYCSISFEVPCTSADHKAFEKIMEAEQEREDEDGNVEWVGGFDVDYRPNHGGHGGMVIWTEEACDIDELADLLQTWMQDPEVSVNHVAFSWANTCSKPRLDSFGGGAIFLTPFSQTFTNTDDWMINKVAEWEATK